MTDRDKVIKGIEQCTIDYCSKEFETQCEDCPYYTAGITLEECRKELRDDFHALLKEQESLIHFLEHQREKGHWIFGNTNGHGWMKCSQCCVSQDGQTACYTFCPNCGADMSEGR